MDAFVRLDDAYARDTTTVQAYNKNSTYYNSHALCTSIAASARVLPLDQFLLIPLDGLFEPVPGTWTIPLSETPIPFLFNSANLTG